MGQISKEKDIPKKRMNRNIQRQNLMKLIYAVTFMPTLEIDTLYQEVGKLDTSLELQFQNSKEHILEKEDIKKKISLYSKEVDLEMLLQEGGSILYQTVDDFEDIQSHNIEEYEDIEYLEKGFKIFLEKAEEIDTQIESLLESTWKIGRIAKMELAILRTAIVDIKYMQVPYKVAINEALNLAKKYSDEKSSRFINGVLKDYSE